MKNIREVLTPAPMDTDTIAEGKRHVNQHIVKGCQCPLCGQDTRIWRRKIYKPMVIALWRMRAVLGRNPIIEDGKGYIESIALQAGLASGSSSNFTLLKHWGMAETLPQTSMWRITQRGLDFLAGRISVPKYAFIYNKKVCGFSTAELKIKDLKYEYFNFYEMLDTSELDYIRTVGELFKHIRIKRELNGADIARKAGMSPSSLNDIENGVTKRPSDERIKAIATALDINIEYAIGLANREQ